MSSLFFVRGDVVRPSRQRSSSAAVISASDRVPNAGLSCPSTDERDERSVDAFTALVLDVAQPLARRVGERHPRTLLPAQLPRVGLREHVGQPPLGRALREKALGRPTATRPRRTDPSP